MKLTKSKLKQLIKEVITEQQQLRDDPLQHAVAAYQEIKAMRNYSASALKELEIAIVSLRQAAGYSKPKIFEDVHK
tara:strand:+ start:4025 stop:4252 length:228 start_codon:yes stop_codon:yes gene_type:complete